MPDVQRFGMPMELRLELCPIVRLQDVDSEWEPLPNAVKEADYGALVAGIIDLQNSDPGAIVDGSELIKALCRTRDALEELHVHLQAVAGLGLLVALPSFAVRLVLLIGR